MGFLLSFISSGSIKWLVILLLMFGIGTSIYLSNKHEVEVQKKLLQQELIIKQYEDVVKQKDAYLKQLQQINKERSDIVNDLLKNNEKVESSHKDIEIEIQKNIDKGHDRPSSKVLKDVFKRLGEQQ